MYVGYSIVYICIVHYLFALCNTKRRIPINIVGILLMLHSDQSMWLVSDITMNLVVLEPSPDIYIRGRNLAILIADLLHGHGQQAVCRLNEAGIVRAVHIADVVDARLHLRELNLFLNPTMVILLVDAMRQFDVIQVVVCRHVLSPSRVIH